MSTNPLTQAFAKLRKSGIIARQNFSCCSSCATYEIGDMLRNDPSKRGFAFYHAQDAQRLRKHGLCHIGYGGKIDSTPEEDAAIGREVVAALTDAGIRTRWNGASDNRIEITL